VQVRAADNELPNIPAGVTELGQCHLALAFRQRAREVDSVIQWDRADTWDEYRAAVISQKVFCFHVTKDCS
jgi:hypothetical protein